MSGLKSGWLVPLFRNESHRGLFVSSAVPYLVTVGTSSVLLKVPERFKNSPQKVPILSLRPKCCLCDSLSPSPTVLQKKRKYLSHAAELLQKGKWCENCSLFSLHVDHSAIPLDSGENIVLMMIVVLHFCLLNKYEINIIILNCLSYISPPRRMPLASRARVYADVNSHRFCLIIFPSYLDIDIAQIFRY